MILGWFITRIFQERFQKLSQKSQPSGAKFSHLAIDLPGTLRVLDVSQHSFNFYFLLKSAPIYLMRFWVTIYRFISAWPAVTRVFRLLRLLVWTCMEAILELWVHAWICVYFVQLTPPIVYHAYLYSASARVCASVALHVQVSVSPFLFCWYQRSWIVHASFVSLQAFIDCSCAWFIASMVQL